MQGSLAKIFYLEFICLKINDGFVFIYYWTCFNFIKPTHLFEGLQQQAEFILISKNDNVEEPITKAGLWGDCKIISKLIAVSNADKKMRLL